LIKNNIEQKRGQAMDIDGKTRLIGLIGNPVEHTLSPVIHNGISKGMGVNSVYVPFKVEADGVDVAVKGAYELNVLGMNVTVPHKNRVMKSLVDIDGAAKQIGAVNTLVRVEGGYKGYNTDMLGLRRQIREDGIDLAGETVVILGAGGAAKAVVYMCLSEGAKKVYLLNRTVEKAKDIAASMNESEIVPGTRKEVVVESSVLERGFVVPMALQDYDKIEEDRFVVFQATSIGLSPNVEDVVLSDKAFYQKVKIGVDLIYNPANTRFMQLVTEAGGKAYNALKMLLYQGVIAYELWHEVTVPQHIIDDIYVDLKRCVYPKDNIVLIGFMGSGKTTVGKELAQRLQMDFLDTDSYIEEKAGKTITEIFHDEGEEAFRKLETEALEHLRDTVSHTVFSTGGGMPLRVENARLLKEIGKVYYLMADSYTIYDRVKDNTDRPLLQGENPYEKICSLMNERKLLYEKAADVVVDTNSNDLDEVCLHITGDV
jgi:shikimate dehydrogenase